MNKTATFDIYTRSINSDNYMMRILRLISISLLAGLFFISIPVQACSVLSEPGVSQYAYTWGDEKLEFFIGTVDSIEVLENNFDLVTFRVHQVLQGSEGESKQVYVATQGPNEPINSCGPLINSYKQGESYMVVASTDDVFPLTIRELQWAFIHDRKFSSINELDRELFARDGVTLLNEIDGEVVERDMETVDEDTMHPFWMSIYIIAIVILIVTVGYILLRPHRE